MADIPLEDLVSGDETVNGDLDVLGNISAENLGTAAEKDVTTSSTDTTPGRVLKVGDGGILSFKANIPQITDFTDQHPAGFYKAVLSSDIGQPAGLIVSNNCVIKVINAEGGAVYELSVVTSNTARMQTWYGYRNSSTGDLNWKEVFDSGNLNANEFGVNAANDVVAVGWARDSTRARFILPINSFAPPTSITVANTFYIFDTNTSSVNASGLTPVINAQSSGKACILEISGLTGLTKGAVLLLQTDSSSSKVTVNF